MALITVVQRAPYACGPQLLSEGCISSFWHWLGNVATFWWVSDWEALLGALIALIAALIGAHFIRKQIDVTRSLDQEARLRRAAANRAMLPLALSSVNSFAEDCAVILTDYHSALTTPLVNTAAIAIPELPKMPVDGLPVFQGVVENENDDAQRNAVIELIRDMQVLAARLQSIPEKANRGMEHVTPSEINDMLIYCVLVHGRSSNLFAFARDERRPMKPLANAIWNSFSILGLDDPISHERVRQWLEKRYGLETSYDFPSDNDYD